MKRPPEVLNGNCPDADRKAGKCKWNTQIISVSANEETDGAFYVIAAWGRVIAVTGDVSLEKDFYATLKTYMEYYFTPGAKSSGGTCIPLLPYTRIHPPLPDTLIYSLPPPTLA